MLAGAEPGVIENVVLRDIQLTYPTVDDPALETVSDGLGQFFPDNPWVRHQRGCVVAEGIRNLVISNLMVSWPESDQLLPEEWNMPLKARNGTFELLPRERFTDSTPAFPVVGWSSAGWWAV